MKFVFVDEFKAALNSKNIECYGLSAIVIDSYYYRAFRVGFQKAFSDLGWGKEEIKGNYTYSKKCYEEISTKKRIDFAKNILSLSSSRSGKTAIIKAYVSFDFFTKKTSEAEKYYKLLSRIMKRIDQPKSKKGDKGIVSIYIDENSCLEENTLINTVTENMKERNILFEKPFAVKSNNLTPGIILADFISYFHINMICWREYYSNHIEDYSSLDEKYQKKCGMKPEELKRLINFLTKENKNLQSGILLQIFKNIKYV